MGQAGNTPLVDITSVYPNGTVFNNLLKVVNS